MSAMVPYGRFNVLDDLFDAFTSPRAVAARETCPAVFQMDVQENPDGYVVEAFLPGVSRDEIDLELNEGRLNVSVDKKDSEEVAKRTYIHRETGEWRAVRSIFLKDADSTGLTAALKDGVLTVNIPKRTKDAGVTKILIG